MIAHTHPGLLNAALATDPHATTQEFRLDIISDPDPDIPAVIVWFRATTPAAATVYARRVLAQHHGPDDRFGELYQRDG